MNKEKETKKFDVYCGGIKPYNPIKPPKDRDAKRIVKSTKKNKGVKTS